MSKKVPEDVAKEIKEIVYNEADTVNYLAQTRTYNGNFLAQLVSMPKVGGRLSQYMKKAEVKTYIKDAILNRYSKDKTVSARPDDFKKIIDELFSVKANFIEFDSRSQISLFSCHQDGRYFVVADGTVLKWETALRKALLYIASKPSFESKNINIVLTLFARYQKVCASDFQILSHALSICNAKIYIYGDC